MGKVMTILIYGIVIAIAVGSTVWVAETCLGIRSSFIKGILMAPSIIAVILLINWLRRI